MKKLLCLLSAGIAIQLSAAELVTPIVEWIDGPLSPLQIPEADQSILLGSSAHQTSSDTGLRYGPLEDGGFSITDGDKSFNRTITIGRNNLVTGDRPYFKLHTTTGSGVYPSAEDKNFPLFPREDALQAKAAPALGTLRLFVLNQQGNPLWLDQLKGTQTFFRPGYTRYELTGPDVAWQAKITIAPQVEQHGFVCKVEFDRPVVLGWTYGDVFWSAKESNSNQVRINKNQATLTEINLPNGVVLVGWDGTGTGSIKNTKQGESVQFQASEKQTTYHMVGSWGVTEVDSEAVDTMVSRLDLPADSPWEKERDTLKATWLDCYINRALDPEETFSTVLKNPAAEFQKAIRYWDERRNEYQIQTPDPYLNALVNFERCVSEYHQMGPGMVLSSFKWIMYSHISVGWYGKLWSGDVEEVKNHMRFLQSMQAEDGFMNWVSPSLAPYHAENNTPYWVDHVWWIYCWTGDTDFIKEMWPGIKKAVAWECTNNDPDGDGLFQSKYEYWNCDSNGKGPKAATPTTTAWAMHDRAAKMAAVVGDTDAQAQYQAMADKIRTQAFEQLWSEEQGVLGSIGGNGVWRGHPQTWEQYLGINNGLIPPEKGIRAMRWLESHYGFEGDDDINLLMNCDWWPLRWSVHWVPTGDTCLAVLAGMKSGDADLWWPYLKTTVGSAFRSDVPGVRFSIGNNSGTGGGGTEFIDSDDPYMHVTMRGLFGIEPEVQNGRLNITPGFPSDWNEASLKSPLVSYTYARSGDQIELVIETPSALVKSVCAYPGAAPIMTSKERRSVVRYSVANRPENPRVEAAHEPVLTEKTPPTKEPSLPAEDRRRLEMLDLSNAYNITLRKLVNKTHFVTDYGTPTTIKGWWHTVPGHMNEGPEKITTDTGVDFLLKGRNESVTGSANNLLALSSWGKPYSLPAAARVQINKKVEKVWLLMQNYVSPIKNYIPNGEIVLHYASGKPDIISLIPPYNMDCYFQAFSREGTSVDLGELEWEKGWSTCTENRCKAQANALTVPCDPSRILKNIKIRATVSEGVIGINAITLLPALEINKNKRKIR